MISACPLSHHSLFVLTPADPANFFVVKLCAQVYDSAPLFIPSAVSVDSTAVSVAAALSAPFVNAAGHVDVASSTPPGHDSSSSAAVASGSTYDPESAEDSLSVSTAMSGCYAPTA